MKRIIAAAIMAAVVLLMLQAVALADAEEFGQEITIGDECSFTIKSVKSYDVFFNQESGSTKDWLVVSFELLNWRTDQFFVKTETKAQIIYDDDFEFEADYLWPNPVGTYYMKSYNETIYVYYIDEHGGIYSNGDDMNYGLEKLCLKIYSYERFYDPLKDEYVATVDSDPNDPDHYVSMDSSKTILDPLVERTYYYVFLVPDLVAEEEGNRELIFTVCGEEYSFRF